MKAIHIPSFVSDPSTLQPTDVPKPVPNPDQCLIKITHCSPQHADILHAQGKHQNNNPKKGWCHPPFILGYDFAGTVESTPTSTSSGQHGFQVGDRVFGAGIGAFAEYIAVSPSAIRKVPSGLDSATACGAAGQAVSYAAVVHVAKVQAGETVLVSGASGGLGSACCMVARAKGAKKVIALVGDERKAESMRREMGAGVDVVVTSDDIEDESWVAEVLESTGGEGVDVVLDNTGMVNSAIRCLAYMGRIIVLGFAARKGVMESVKMNKLLLKSATVVGYRFGESGRRKPGELARIWEGYLGMLEAGELKVLMHGVYRGLGDVGRALGDLHERKVLGKVVVSVGSEEEDWNRTGSKARL